MQRARGLHLFVFSSLLFAGGCKPAGVPPVDAAAMDFAVSPVADLAAIDASMPDQSTPDLIAPTCTTTGTSNLNGVSIKFTGTRCTFTLAEAAAGIVIPWEIDIANAVSGVIPRPQDAGHCGRPDGSGLIPFASVDGNGQHYCLCDVGFCFQPPQNPMTLQPGAFPESFSWMGHNWLGPSDTGNPMGAPFPAGEYQVLVSVAGAQRTAMGDQAFSVQATLGITLTP
jgi:hypothetical protein